MHHDVGWNTECTRAHRKTTTDTHTHSHGGERMSNEDARARVRVSAPIGKEGFVLFTMNGFVFFGERDSIV